MPRRIPPIVDLRTHPTKFVRPTALGRYLGIARRTIYNHIDKGALKTVKRGGILVVRIADAREYAAEA